MGKGVGGRSFGSHQTYQSDSEERILRERILREPVTLLPIPHHSGALGESVSTHHTVSHICVYVSVSPNLALTQSGNCLRTVAGPSSHLYL